MSGTDLLAEPRESVARRVSGTKVSACFDGFVAGRVHGSRITIANGVPVAGVGEA